MKKYTVYKLLDENGQILWAGSTSHSIRTRIEQHRMLPMHFAGYEVDRSYKTQKRALKRVDQLLNQIGDLPPYLVTMLA